MKTKLLLFAFFLLFGATAYGQTPCNAAFTYSVNPSGVVTFTGTASSPGATYSWNFGNGTAGSGINTSSLYNTPGVYTICLYVTDTTLLIPCTDSSCVTITVGTPPACSAYFYAFLDTAGGSPWYTYFVTNMSSGTGLSYVWNWGDGSANSTGASPSHQYTTPGTYNMCLYIDDGAGCTDTFCQVINIPPASSCSSSFYLTPNNSPAAPAFTYNSQNYSIGLGLNYTWIWNDGSPNSTGFNPSHTFPSAGTYTVCLAISNSSGCNDTSCQIVTVNPPTSPCNAYFTVVPDTSVGASPHTYIGFNWSTGVGISYTWIWGDGSANGSGPYPTHTYPAAGVYNICLVVMGGGCVDSFCLSQLINKTEADMYSVTFQAPTSIKDITKKEVAIYPNPANDKLYIDVDKTLDLNVDIYNLHGSVVLSRKTKGNTAINVSELPTNIYMVKISYADGRSEYAKFVKQ